MTELRQKINDDYKQAMLSRDHKRRDAIQLLRAEIKRRDVDQQRELNGDEILGVLNSMVKQRKDSASQYEKAGRQDLYDQEQYEITTLKEYMPAELSEEEVKHIIAETIDELQVTGLNNMSKVMSALRPQLQGRTDMGKASQLVKSMLSA